MNNENPNYQVTEETKVEFKGTVLEGRILRAKKVTTTFEVKRGLHPKSKLPFRVVAKNKVNEVIEPLTFYLREVTPEELAVYREDGISSFVLKIDGKLYHTRIPDNLSCVDAVILGQHKCAVAGYECRRLSAASDEQGGCAKVRDRSQRIERYPWITKGYETFNTRHDTFAVVTCLHYKKCPPRKKLSAEERNRLRLGLAQFVWDDVTSREEVNKRVSKSY